MEFNRSILNTQNCVIFLETAILLQIQRENMLCEMRIIQTMEGPFSVCSNIITSALFCILISKCSSIEMKLEIERL